ncbi:MAG: cyclase family protein [Nitrospinota bacterium]
MARIVDLTLPIKPHWRWRFEVEKVLDYAKGDPLLDCTLTIDDHSFTHMDSPLHVEAGKTSLDRVPLDNLIGMAAVLNLSDVGDGEEITAEELENRAGHLRPGDMALMRSSLELRHSWESADFWKKAPYFGKSACRWVLDRGIKVVGFDFPNDYVVRELFGGERTPRVEEFLCHDIMLRAGVLMIEYMCNLHALRQERVMLYALPIKIEGGAGAPARVLAIED